MTAWRDESRFNAEGFYGELQLRLQRQQEALEKLRRRTQERLDTACTASSRRWPAWRDDSVERGTMTGQEGSGLVG
eukprot:s1970_g11.t1